MVTLSPNAPQAVGGMAPPEQPNADPNKPKRNRNVSSPGSRGGHFRRVWSNKLHKFYIKYGKDQGNIDVDNADTVQSRRPPSQAASAPESINIAVPSRVPENSLEELLNGLFEELLRNFRAGDEGTGLHHKGRAISFGKVTPARGEITTEDNHRRGCYLYDEDGNTLQVLRRRIKNENRLRNFYCYMVARYAMKQFIDGEKKKMERSLFLVSGNGSDVLRKASTINVKSNTEHDEFAPLRRSLQLLQEAHRPQVKAPRSVVQNRLTKAFRALDELEEEALEKAGPKQIWNDMAPSSAGSRYGTVGSGSTSVFRLPGRPRGTSQNLTVASANLGMSVNTGPTMSPSDPQIEVSEKDFRGHKHLKIGARVRVKHPYEHEKPIWGKITGVGEHGIQVTDDEGNVTNIRWPHIFDLQPRIENTPQTAFELARMRIPMEGVSTIASHQSDALERELRRVAMPFDKDIIHAGHDDKGKAYSYLFSEKVPIDDVEATRISTEASDMGVAKLTQGLINHALSMRVPVDTDLLKELPFDRVIAVIHHHLNNKEAQNG